MKKAKDSFALVATSFLVTAAGVCAFLAAEIYHFSPFWIFLLILSIGFFGAVGWDFRKEFHRPLFVLFFCVWLLLNFAVFMFVREYFGWLLYPIAVFIELFLFYASAYWLFGLDPPLARKEQ